MKARLTLEEALIKLDVARTEHHEDPRSTDKLTAYYERLSDAIKLSDIKLPMPEAELTAELRRLRGLVGPKCSTCGRQNDLGASRCWWCDNVP